jgi:hypothetical protein
MKLNRHWLVALGLSLAACGGKAKDQEKDPEQATEPEAAPEGEAEGEEEAEDKAREDEEREDEGAAEEGEEGAGEAGDDEETSVGGDDGGAGSAADEAAASTVEPGSAAERMRLARERRTERLALRQGLPEQPPGTSPPAPRPAPAPPAPPVTAPPGMPSAAPPRPPPPAPPQPARPTPPPSAGPRTDGRRGIEPSELERLLPLAEAVSLSGAKSLKPGAPLSGLAAVDGHGSVHYATTRGDFGVSLQIWRDESPRDAEDRFRRLRMQHHGAEDVAVFSPLRGFFSGYGPMQSLTVGKPDKRVIATVTCAEKVCNHATLLKIARAVEARL